MTEAAPRCHIEDSPTGAVRSFDRAKRARILTWRCAAAQSRVAARVGQRGARGRGGSFVETQTFVAGEERRVAHSRRHTGYVTRTHLPHRAIRLNRAVRADERRFRRDRVQPRLLALESSAARVVAVLPVRGKCKPRQARRGRRRGRRCERRRRRWRDATPPAIGLLVLLRTAAPV